MKFPDVARVVYQSNPLVEVVCQLAFPRVFAIETALPADFQDALGSEFPFVQVREVVRISAPAGGKSEPTFSQLYDFISGDERFTLTLSSDFLALSTRDYAEWEEFEEKISLAHDALQRSYSIPFFTRVGLRYINAIDRELLGLGGKDWATLIKPSAIGLISDPEVSITDLDQHSMHTIFSIAGGKLSMRYGLMVEDGELKQDKFGIDCDLYCTGKIEVTKDALGAVRKFNGEARNAFRWLIEPPTHEALQK